MSMRVMLSKAVAQGLLCLVEPRMPSEPMIRFLYASKDVHDYITGPWTNKEDEFRCGKLWADFDRFVEGGVIPVSLNHPHHKPQNTYLSRLHPAENEVWVIRSRAPKPGLRVFGRFAGRDCFVALRWRRRKELGGADSEEFHNEMCCCKAVWRRIFPACDPLKGNNVDEYISKALLI